MRKFTWLNYLLVYFLWSIVLLVGLWFLLLSRNTFLSVFTTLYVKDSIVRAWQIRSLEKFYTLGVGLAWLAMTILTEVYFRAAVHRARLLFQRFALILGIELLLIFVADAMLLFVQGLGMTIWSRWLILGVELVLGVGCLIFARADATKGSMSPADDRN